MPDLFGHDVETSVAGDGQISMFGEGEGRIPSPVAPDIMPDPNRVRRKLHVLLETARRAERMPWEPRKARMWQTVFPQMANWLPDEERDQLRFEFAQEMERLQRVA
ncbi:MAG: hypothetical protein ACK5SX_14710 [Sandaracinobacter sp.]